MKTKREIVSGVVETVYYASPTFSAGRLVTDGGDQIKFAGKVFIREHDAVRLEGRWKIHPKFGRQFSVDSIGYELEMDPDGLANFLANHPKVKGIGPAKARLIADRFGRDFDAAIINRPEEIAAAAKIPIETALEMRRIWVANRDFNDAMTHLSAYGLTHHQVTTLVDKFGSQVVSILERDPYMLIREIPGFGFRRVDKIARKMGTPKNLPSRIRAALQYCVLDQLENGDCWVEYEDLLDRANNLLLMDELNSRELIEARLEELIQQGLLVEALYDRRVVADAQIHSMETELAAVLRRAARRGPHTVTALSELIDTVGRELNREQREAVRNALTFSISLIAGGAGSGKTYAVSTISRIAARLNWEVVLAAPTGKAARRLEEVVGHPAVTIHRLLGFDGKRYARGPEDPIDADIIIVDEVSMVDVPLAWHLFRSIDLERTAVVLVGDHNQLPPVGPGHILRDLVRSSKIPTTILGQIIRQAGQLKENCTAILNGEVRPTAGVESGSRRPWYVIDRFSERDDVLRMLMVLFDEVLSERLGYHLIRDVQVLTPTHNGMLGTVNLNQALQRRVQKKLFGVDVPESSVGHRPIYYAGDKVIQTRNDYELGVMNGAIGYVVCAESKGKLTVDFDGAIVEIDPASDAARCLQLAYACSIHKVQGSEFPCVIVVAHKSHTFLHNRNLLYTAVTRAKESVIILGDRWGITHCAARQQVDRRNTFLSFMLTLEAEHESRN